MKISKLGAVETAAPSDAEGSVTSDIARSATAFCDQALDLLYTEHRDGNPFAGLEDVVTAIEAARTELIRLETSCESQG